MLTSTLVIALAGFLAGNALESPSWHADYDSARGLGMEGSKPLAVFISSGKAGWNQVSRERQLGDDVKQVLAKNYICVYVDTSLQAGKQLASEFEVPDGLGLVISDHTGKYQAFHHRGDLSNVQLLHYLSRYADPKGIVRTTETNPPQHSESYQESYPVFWSGGGRSC